LPPRNHEFYSNSTLPRKRERIFQAYFQVSLQKKSQIDIPLETYIGPLAAKEFCLRSCFMAKAMMPEDQHPGMVNPDHFGELARELYRSRCPRTAVQSRTGCRPAL